MRRLRRLRGTWNLACRRRAELALARDNRRIRDRPLGNVPERGASGSNQRARPPLKLLD